MNFGGGVFLAGANLQAQTTEGETCLYQAAYYNHKDVVRILLKAKCDVNAVNRLGQPILFAAAKQNLHDILEILLKNGADVNIQDAKGASAAHVASQYGNTRILQVRD